MFRIPFVGEVLHFYNFPKGTHPGPQAAIVAFHWPDDESVNVAVLDPHGSISAATGISVIQPGEPAPEKQAYCEFITQEDRVPDVNIKENNDAEKPKGQSTPNPYAGTSQAK